MPHYQVVLNSTRVGDDAPEAFRRSEAARTVRLFLAPDGVCMTDADIPEHLVTDAMVDRFLAIQPPRFRTPSEYDAIVEAIERSYVLGMCFPALSSAVVTIERLLNAARIALHPLVAQKIPSLWKKGALNEWEGNIAALEQWQYLDATLAAELRRLFGVRCQYLHSGNIGALEADTLAAIRGAYALLNCLLGFPDRLFQFASGQIQCVSPNDPLVRAFYHPIQAEQ